MKDIHFVLNKHAWEISARAPSVEKLSKYDMIKEALIDFCELIGHKFIGSENRGLLRKDNDGGLFISLNDRIVELDITFFENSGVIPNVVSKRTDFNKSDSLRLNISIQISQNGEHIGVSRSSNIVLNNLTKSKAHSSISETYDIALKMLSLKISKIITTAKLYEDTLKSLKG
jgi:hypothetical protein